MKTLRLTGTADASAVGERSLREILASSGEGDAAIASWLAGLENIGVVEGQTLPMLLGTMELSLWTWARILLQTGPLAERVRTIEALWGELWAERPDEVEPRGLIREDEILVERLCSALGILYQGARHGPQRPKPSAWRQRPRRPWRRRVRSSLDRPPSGVQLLCVVAGEETTVSWAAQMLRLLWPELELNGLEARVALLGPATPSLDSPARTETTLEIRLDPYRVEAREPAAGEVAPDPEIVAGTLTAVWKRIRDLPGLGDVLTHRGVRFGDLARQDLEAVLLGRLRDAVGVWGRATALLAGLAPATTCVFCDGNGQDRAAADACRMAGRLLVLAERRPGCAGATDVTCAPAAGPGDAPQLARTLVNPGGLRVHGSV